MSGLTALIGLVYVAGVMWGLFVIDASPGVRIGLALFWPLGPIAFAVTITILLGASLIAFPTFGAVVVATALLAWLVL